MLRRGAAIGRSSFRKSHPPRNRVWKSVGRGYCVSARAKRAPAKGRERRTYVEVGATDRERSHYSGMFAQRHPFRSGRERGRESYPPKNQPTGRDGIRGPPGATTDGFTPVHTRDCRRGRGANCATIWFTSSKRKTAPVARGRRRSCVDTLL